MMENLRYSAPNTKQIAHLEAQQNFVSKGLLFLLALLVLVVLVALFPGRSLVYSLSNQTGLSLVDFRYSLLLLKHNTDLPISVEMAERNPFQLIEYLVQGAQTFYQKGEEENLWLSYAVVKAITYNLVYSKNIKAAGKQAMMDYFRLFQKLPTSVSQLKTLAYDAIALDEAPFALIFYDAILQKDPNQSVDFYQMAAKAALWTRQCNKSAQYYWMAKDRAVSLKDKRYLYLKAMSALFSCEQYALALSEADRHLSGLENDPETYQELAELALKANQPQKAEFYVRKMLELRARKIK